LIDTLRPESFKVRPRFGTASVLTASKIQIRRTTWGEPGQKLTLDIDPSTHPAWTGGQQQLIDRGGRLSRFNKRFSGYVKTPGEK
jgi:large subunit ribosomal protein L31